MAINCKVCNKELDAFSGGRCRKCRQLVCSDCVADGGIGQKEGILCKSCATNFTDETATPLVVAEKVSRSPLINTPYWIISLVAVIMLGVFSLIVIYPYLQAREALNEIEYGDGDLKKTKDLLAKSGNNYLLKELVKLSEEGSAKAQERAVRSMGAIKGQKTKLELTKMSVSPKTAPFLQSVITEALLEHERRYPEKDK